MKFITHFPSAEIKSERTQLLLRPTVKRGAKKVAKLYGISLNDYVNRVLEKDIRKELSYD